MISLASLRSPAIAIVIQQSVTMTSLPFSLEIKFSPISRWISIVYVVTTIPTVNIATHFRMQSIKLMRFSLRCKNNNSNPHLQRGYWVTKSSYPVNVNFDIYFKAIHGYNKIFQLPPRTHNHIIVLDWDLC